MDHVEHKVGLPFDRASNNAVANISDLISPVPGVQPNVPSSRNYEGGFRIELCKKVLEMGSELARQANARTVLDKPTLKAFEEAAADPRYKGKDARVVYKWLNEST